MGKPKGPVLDLQCNIIGRDDPITPELEEECRLLKI
jgi:hypothetical protein